MTDLPVQIKGLEDGFSIDLYRVVEDNKEVLVVAATNADGESIQVTTRHGHGECSVGTYPRVGLRSCRSSSPY